MSDGRGGLPYWVWLSLLVAVSLGVLLVIVFAVFPQRFVLAPGLREQGLNFPAEAPAFELPAGVEFVRPPPPEEGPPTGPAERFWSRVEALVGMGRHEMALKEFRDWLERRPDDHDARLEYARTLERAGHLRQARAEFRRVAEATGRRAARLALARLRWRLGDLDGALALYDTLAAARPGDRAVLRERADLLSSLGRHREAARAYRRLLERRPSDPELRLALARALRAGGSLPAAWREASKAVSSAPPGSPVAEAAAAVRAELHAEIALPADDTVPASVLARARAAAAAGELERAEELYRVRLFLDPGHRAARLELAEMLATRRDAPAEAAALLEAAPARPEGRLSEKARRRLARYRLWAGDDGGALRILRALASEGSATADDLALMGDLLRWRGDRPAADDRYEQALALDPGHGRAVEGRRALAADVRRTVEERDPAGTGVRSGVFLDSDDFRRWEAEGRARLDPGWDTHRLLARAGLQSLRGPTPAGPRQEEEETGPTGQIGWVGWWRQATVRTEVRVGAEHLEATGTEPVVAAEVSVPGLGLETLYRHGPAHPTTLTFASVQDQTRIDRFRASLFRQLGGGGWGLWLSAEGSSVRGGGTDNGRFVAQAAVDRPVALDGMLRAGYVTRMLTTDEPAPVTGAGLSTYWSPSLSWTHGLSLELDRPRGETGWGWHARVQPGGSLVRLHGAGEEAELEFSFFGQGGVEYRTGRVAVSLQGDYVQTRVGDYEAFGASLELNWRF